MAQILFTAVGAAAGKAVGGGLIGNLIGMTLSAAGGFVDRALFGKKVKRQVDGPRLDSLGVTSSTEGNPIYRIFGRARISGQLIWSTRKEEEILTTTEKQGGKGISGGTKSTTTTTTQAFYYGNFALGLCEGEIAGIGRVWADGKELDIREYTYRLYLGTEAQSADSLIVTKEGAGNAPAYRGLAYIVFERMPLERFGNRVPQFMFEIYKPIAGAVAEGLVKGVNVIPASTEFGYDPVVVEQSYPSGSFNNVTKQIENTRTFIGGSDWDVSMDQLQKTCPNIDTVCLVVSWFGDDLRAASCTIKPRVDSTTKQTAPHSWAVASLTRSTATLVSQVSGRSAFGGTPNDGSVTRAIQDLTARGLRVMLYPFILMDIPSTNTLPNPYSANAATNGQAAFPWRGRITCSPAPGYAGTVDKTATAGTQIDTFYNATWGYKRFIEHYATLAAAAGGVDYFCIGSEMVGLTSVRESASSYPFVDNLVALAGSVSAILGSGVKVGYAADWSEYHSHRPDDGTGDVYFNMDTLWSSADIDFVGIDNYLPLSDWRDGLTHLDFLDGWASIYDRDYIKANVEGGEYADWYYASAAARTAQTRTAIADATYGKPWVFGNKRIKDWWNNAHYNRPAGVESGSPTAWTAQGKPIYFTEFGCPAIDKGTNQPNVFTDSKSSESLSPYFSSGARDDFIQRQAIRAFLEYWGDNANNPASGVYAGRMIDMDNVYIWSWDARPQPSFPFDTQSWPDAANWHVGHWISGRFGGAPISELLSELATDYEISGDIDFTRAYGFVDGLVLDRIMSFREAVAALELMFFFDFVESGGMLTTISKYEINNVATIDTDLLIARPKGDPIQFTRTQEIDLPVSAQMEFINGEAGYRTGAISASRQTRLSKRFATTRAAIVTHTAAAYQIMVRWLYSLWAERDAAEFSVMPSMVKLEGGDAITVDFNGRQNELQIARITDGAVRNIVANSFDRTVFGGGKGAERTVPAPNLDGDTSPTVFLMDLPMLTDADVEHQGYIAGFATPWPGGIVVYRSVTDANYALNNLLSGPATVGELRFELFSGPEGRWDHGNTVFVRILGGTLSSQSEETVLAGANAMAVENADGEWEILQFVSAELEATREYALTQLLRGQRGTESAMRDSVAAGARVVFFNLAVQQASIDVSKVNAEFYWRHGPLNKEISSDLYTTEQFAFTGLGRRPYSPTNIKATVDGSNNVVITWKRRTRIDGDSWDYAVDVPLAEESEAYEIDIMDGATVLRTLTSSTQTVSYSSANQTTDWGSLADDFDVIIYQISIAYGRGAGRRQTLYLEGYR